MGGRLTTSSPPAATHRNTGHGSTTNLSQSRIHANSIHNHSQIHRHRSNSGHHHSHGLLRNSSSNHNRNRTTSAATFNFNLLPYVGIERESDGQSSDDESPQARRRLHRILIAIRDVPCPVCNKTIPSDSFDKHIVQCLSKPRVDYNGMFYFIYLIFQLTRFHL